MNDPMDAEARDALDASNAEYDAHPYEWRTGWPGWNLYMRQVRMAEALRVYEEARLALHHAVRGVLRQIGKSSQL